MPAGSENAPASWIRTMPSDTGVCVTVAGRSDQRIVRLTVNCGTTAEARVTHWRIGNHFFDLDVDAFLKDVRGGIETVRQVMYRVVVGYMFSSTVRIVTTNVLRNVAIAPGLPHLAATWSGQNERGAGPNLHISGEVPLALHNLSDSRHPGDLGDQDRTGVGGRDSGHSESW